MKELVKKRIAERQREMFDNVARKARADLTNMVDELREAVQTQSFEIAKIVESDYRALLRAGQAAPSADRATQEDLRADMRTVLADVEARCRDMAAVALCP